LIGIGTIFALTVTVGAAEAVPATVNAISAKQKILSAPRVARVAPIIVSLLVSTFPACKHSPAKFEKSQYRYTVPVRLDAQFTQVQGLRTRYFVSGSGPAVLVLHGWGANIEAVHPIVAGLGAVGRVYALDLPGFGETQPPPKPWGVEDYQAFVASFMDALAIERPVIVGHSNGGRIAIRMACTEPTRASKLVLVDSAGIRPKRTFRWYRRVGMAKLGKYAARFLGAPGERLRTLLVGRVASADYLAAGAMQPTLVRLVNADLRPYMPGIEVPTLLVWGADDADTPLSDGREMERLIPDSGLVVLEDAGHYSYLDQPSRFAVIVSHFISPPDAGAGSGGASGGGVELGRACP
jgi:pimeloyl-ACP methyl ester carboxylesterase